MHTPTHTSQLCSQPLQTVLGKRIFLWRRALGPSPSWLGFHSGTRWRTGTLLDSLGAFAKLRCDTPWFSLADFLEDAELCDGDPRQKQNMSWHVASAAPNKTEMTLKLFSLKAFSLQQGRGLPYFLLGWLVQSQPMHPARAHHNLKFPIAKMCELWSERKESWARDCHWICGIFYGGGGFEGPSGHVDLQSLRLIRVGQGTHRMFVQSVTIV